MGEAKFTPGNWTIHDRSACQENWAVGSDHDFPGAPGTTHRRYVAQIMSLQDAHLVSAGKELYDALKVFAAEPLSTEPGHNRTRLFSLEDLDEKIRRARDAIAKAEGRG